MKKIFLFLATLTIFFISPAQNVGIGTTTPAHPLSFANTLGDKISLYGGAGNHYGFGIQGSLMQLYSDAPEANIGFGYGYSSNFTERMRIINSGSNGLQLSGRMILKNGTNPLDLAHGTGVWMYKADNTALLGFMGVQNNQNIGFYGGSGGWGFTYDAVNSRVGIGNNNPNAPLSFPPLLGKKITLYPGATGDVGFAVAGNRLQIYADNPNADVAIGYDAAGVFNERFAVKPNGALAVNGNTGSSGQIIQSAGSGASALWTNIGNLVKTFYSVGGIYNNVDVTDDVNWIDIPLASPLSFTLPYKSRNIISANFTCWGPYCPLGCGDACAEITIEVDGNMVTPSSEGGITCIVAGANSRGNANISNYFYDLPAGPHTIKFKAKRSTIRATNVIMNLACIEATIIALPID